MSVIDSIKHYQRSIEKYPEDEKRLLHCIGKLANLPISVHHLEETGIGRTVNSFRKNDGTIGQAARNLVAKWKELVAADSSDNEEGSDGEHAFEELNEPEDPPEDFLQIAEEVEEEEDEPEPEAPIIAEYSPPHKNHKSSRHDKHSSKSDHNKSAHKDKEKRNHHHENVESKHKSSSHDKEHRSSSKKESKSEKSSSDEHKKHKKKSHKSDKDKEHSKKHESSSSSHHRSDKHHKSQKNGDENYDKQEKHKNNEDKVERSFSKPDTDTKKSDSHKSTKKESSKHHNNSSSSQEDTQNNKKKHRETEELDKYSKKDCDKNKKSKQVVDSKNDEKSRSKSSSKSEEKKHKSKHEKDTSSSSKSSNKKDTVSSTPQKRKLVDFDMMAVVQNGHSSGEDERGIDSFSGTSFADALGSFAAPVKKKIKVAVTSPKPLKSVPQTSPTTPIKNLEAKPDLLSPNAKLAPLNLDITLPAITPNYQPLPNSEVLWDLGGKTSRSEEEALSLVMNKSNQRTKVYSGNKVIGVVPTLFEICIRILQDNIDALAFTGGVPYHILSPILERCTPEQLFTLEHHNAYLLEDTDHLWAHHCKREFRGKRREEFESWREAYSRFLLEREEKLKSLTANIKQTIQKSVPVRQTKLAYVDSVVKPPRGVIRQQAKYGTSSASAKPSVTPASRAAAVANSINVTAPVPVPNPGARASSSSNSHGSFKPKKAPLMQKTLALIKSTNRYRR